jgi:hypothetical protein
MNFETDRFRVPLWLILTAGLSLVTIGIAYWYYKVDPTDSKLLGLVGGLLTGLIVYLFTYITLLRPIIELDQFHRMGIKALLSNRHDKDYYRRLLDTSRYKADVLGASCNRFVRDFLDPDDDDAILIDALNRRRQLRIRLLIPTDAHMSQEGKNATAATMTTLAALKSTFGNRIELRRFDHEARHSFVISDDDLVAGPIFEEDKSRHAPAVHVLTRTLFGQKYSAYFEKLWDSAAVV